MNNKNITIKIMTNFNVKILLLILMMINIYACSSNRNLDDLIPSSPSDNLTPSKDTLDFQFSADSETITTVDKFGVRGFIDSDGFHHIIKSYADVDSTIYTHDWASFQRIGTDSRKLKVMVEENTTNKDRYIRISIVGFNASAFVTVIQSKQ